MIDEQDTWGEGFEETVSAALIACYETKAKKNHGAAPKDRLNDERISVIRRLGPYIASNSRFFEVPLAGSGGVFDVMNDLLPESGVYAFTPNGVSGVERDAYMLINHVNKVDRLGKFWHRQSGGQLYEMMCMSAVSDGVTGERRYFAVTDEGRVVACTQKIPNNRGYQPGASVEIVGPSDKWIDETGFWGGITLQALADRRHCWVIKASEPDAKAYLGCMREEIKSLLYARDLPLTASGRKRPILHVVAAHQRRMQSGVDVDITTFLRGQQSVVIGGTSFDVLPPKVLKPEVSENSRRRYYERAGHPDE